MTCTTEDQKDALLLVLIEEYFDTPGLYCDVVDILSRMPESVTFSDGQFLCLTQQLSDGDKPLIDNIKEKQIRLTGEDGVQVAGKRLMEHYRKSIQDNASLREEYERIQNNRDWYRLFLILVLLVAIAGIFFCWPCLPIP